MLLYTDNSLFNCSSGACPACSFDYSQKNTNCTEKMFCNDIPACTTDFESYTGTFNQLQEYYYSGEVVRYEDDATSFGFGFFIRKNTGEDIYCDEDAGVNVWSPKEMDYRDDRQRCERPTEVCDQGIGGTLQYGCDNLIGVQDDTWGLYNSQCVSRSFLTPIELPSVYDSVCCLSHKINNFELYQMHNKKEDNLKVY